MKGKLIILVLVLVSFLPSSCQQEVSEVVLRTKLDTISYYLGVSMASNLKSGPMQHINPLAVAKGVEDVYSGMDSIYDPMEINKEINEYIQLLEILEGDKNLREANEFLERNGKRKEVVTLESGLQYEVMKEGNGPKPDPEDLVTVHYHGTLTDGTVFDSSVNRGEPVQFPLNRVISGWTEALQLMNTGSRWKLFIPPELGYGRRPRAGSNIKPNVLLIFEVELISIDEER